MSAFSLPIPPGHLTAALHRLMERSATTSEARSQKPEDTRTRGRSFLVSDYWLLKSAASVGGLSPGTSSAQAGLSRPVSYYAFFKGWLLLSQPPGCHGLPTSFPT